MSAYPSTTYPSIYIYILFLALIFLAYFILAHTLAGKQRLRRKEILFITLSSPFATVASFLFSHRIENAVWGFLFGTFWVLLLLFFYFYQIKGKPLKLSFILVVLAASLFTIIDSLVLSIWTELLGFGVFDSERILFHSLTYLILLYVFLVCFIVILRKVMRRFSLDATLIGKYQTIAVVISALILFCFLFVVSLQLHSDSDTIITLFSWSSGFIVIYALAISICFAFYIRTMRAKQTAQEKELEQRALFRYIEEFQSHQKAMQQLRHDFSNVLLSFETFIDKEDYSGLTAYYRTQVKPTTETIIQNRFALEGLEHIKPLEIKGILTAKLALAQNQGLDVTFEAREDITHIPVDSVVLVRMLGILLDNAIEALSKVPDGRLLVGCLKLGSTINFIIENTCPPNMPSIRRLSQTGFTTKGSGRGMGLNILAELSDTLPNVTLSTNIKDGNFVQILEIGGKA